MQSLISDVHITPKKTASMTIEPQLQHVIDRLKALFEKEGWLLDIEPIQYGVKLTLDTGGPKAIGNLYFSKKKRKFSWVPNGNGDKSTAGKLADAVFSQIGEKNAAAPHANGKHAATSSELKLKVWIGTDEAGKGDLFGPLVAAGFIADKEIAHELAKMGVKDSKELKPQMIKRLGAEIRRLWPDRFAVVEISPKKYNEMYGDFERRGGINGILGWAHAKVISELAASPLKPEAAVVDRFSSQDRVKRLLDADAGFRVIERPGGESNLAVAAAAILARSRFDHSLEKMGTLLGHPVHPGSGSPAVDDLERVMREHRPEITNFVKAHFAPVRSRGIL